MNVNNLAALASISRAGKQMGAAWRRFPLSTHEMPCGSPVRGVPCRIFRTDVPNAPKTLVVLVPGLHQNSRLRCPSQKIAHCAAPLRSFFFFFFLKLYGGRQSTTGTLPPPTDERLDRSGLRDIILPNDINKSMQK